MSKTRAIYRGVYILVNNILLRETGSRKKAYELIAKVTHKSSPGLAPNAPFEFLEIITALDSITTITTRLLALSSVRAFRHWVAHERPAANRPLMFQLADSVGTLRKWLSSLHPKIDVFDETDTESLLVEMLEYWLDDMAQNTPSSPDALQNAINASKDSSNEEPVPEPTSNNVKESSDSSHNNSHNNSNLETMIYDNPNVEVKGVLRNLREEGWKDALKHREFIMLDGKHANKHGEFLYWSGTVAKVKFDGEAPIMVPVDKSILVLKKGKKI